MVYISTDFVFDGRSERPYAPDDTPNPINHYGRSKLAGEEAVRQVGGAWLIVRTSWLYGAGGPNFVASILRRARKGEPLLVVDDERGRPTWTGSIAPAILDLAKKGCTGIMHLADRGDATWFEFAKKILSTAGIACDLQPTSSHEWGAPAPSPAYSLLDLSVAEQILSYDMQHWETSLESYLGAEL